MVRMINNTKKKTKRKNDKSARIALIQMFLAIFSLIIVTVGATYSYFSLNASNNFNSISATVNTESVGNVFLSNSNKNLSINLTSTNMIRQDSNINFYASSSGKTTEPTEETIGLITASGNGIFKCEYDLNITTNGVNNMYTKFQSMNDKSTNQIVLTINGHSYDFNTPNLFPIEEHFEVDNVKEGSPKEIKASLKIVNRSDIDQSELAGTDISVIFTANNFTCEVSNN